MINYRNGFRRFAIKSLSFSKWSEFSRHFKGGKVEKSFSQLNFNEITLREKVFLSSSLMTGEKFLIFN